MNTKFITVFYELNERLMINKYKCTVVSVSLNQHICVLIQYVKHLMKSLDFLFHNNNQFLCTVNYNNKT